MPRKGALDKGLPIYLALEFAVLFSAHVDDVNPLRSLSGRGGQDVRSR